MDRAIISAILQQLYDVRTLEVSLLLFPQGEPTKQSTDAKTEHPSTEKATSEQPKVSYAT